MDLIKKSRTNQICIHLITRFSQDFYFSWLKYRPIESFGTDNVIVKSSLNAPVLLHCTTKLTPSDGFEKKHPISHLLWLKTNCIQFQVWQNLEVEMCIHSWNKQKIVDFCQRCPEVLSERPQTFFLSCTDVTRNLKRQTCVSFRKVFTAATYCVHLLCRRLETQWFRLTR